MLSAKFHMVAESEMIAANKAVRKLQAQDVIIMFHTMIIDEKLKIVLYTDSA